MARQQLESAGILARVLDEHVLTTGDAHMAGAGGVKLCVAKCDQERAVRIIYANEDPKRFFCPSCGSRQVRPLRFPRWLRVLFFGPPIHPEGMALICRSCAHQWRDE
ncbi:MAG: putative signal transducing protein [Planctomycetota bacterium]